MLNSRDDIRDFMSHHETEKVSDDFTMNVMSMIESNVVVDDEETPFVGIFVLYVMLAIAFGVIIIGSFINFSVFDIDFNFVQLVSFKSVINYMQSVFFSVKTFLSSSQYTSILLSLGIILFFLLIDSIIKIRSNHYTSVG